MKSIIRILVTVMVLCPAWGSWSPVRAQAPSRVKVQRTTRQTRYTVPSRFPFMRRITVWQSALQKRVTGFLREMKEDFSIGVLLVLLGLSFVYGAIHALGPGHGKIILGSCVIGQPYALREALRASAVFSAVHNGSALLLYTFFILVFGALRRRTSHDITTVMYHVSGGLLILLGLLLLVSVFWKKQEHHQLPERLNRLSLPLACAAAGVVPCPGTLVLLLFTGSLGLVWLGYVLVLGFTAGMLLTLSLVAVLFTTGRNLVSVPLKGRLVIKILRVAGAGLLVIIGIYLILLY